MKRNIRESDDGLYMKISDFIDQNVGEKGVDDFIEIIKNYHPSNYLTDEKLSVPELNDCLRRLKVYKAYNEGYKAERKAAKKNLREGNRVGDSEFVPDFIDQFLEDVAQFSNLFDYVDIIAFEKDVFSPNDKNVKALKKLYRKEHEAVEYDDEEALNKIYQDVADIVTGVVDYEADDNW